MTRSILLLFNIAVFTSLGFVSMYSSAQQGFVDGGIWDDLDFNNYLELYVESECQYASDDDNYSRFHGELCNKTAELILKSVNDEIDNIDKKNNVIFLTNISANLTFVLAHIFLFIGCYMAFKEIRHANALRAAGQEQSIELKVGLEGVALKSSFLGFAVLALALAFYFAYLKFVYPVIVI